MKSAQIIKKIVFSSLFLAGIPAILVILSLPHFGSKFSLAVQPARKYSGQVYYTDLNCDSISEIVYTGKGTPYYFIVARNLDYEIYDQWNLSDSLNPDISGLIFGNYDKDRFEEIYVFTHNRDSLFLNINELLDPAGTRMNRIFITKIGYLRGEVTSILKPAGFFDENGDGFDEFYFGITTGYGREPRKLYYYDIVHNSLKSSQFTGTITLTPRMMDVDGDKKPEIFGTMSSSGNYTRKVPYSDSSNWFMVFNDQLTFKFPPVEFPGFANGLEIFGYKNGNFNGYILSHCKGGTDSSALNSQIMIYSADGTFVRSRPYSDYRYYGQNFLWISHFHQADKIYGITDKFFELNDKLEVVRTINLPFNSNFVTYQADINNDSESEFLLYSDTEEKLAIYSAAFHKLSESKFKVPSANWILSCYLSKEHIPGLFLSAGGNGYVIQLKRNIYYLLGYLAYPGIYLLLLLFIILIKKINTYQVVEKESLNRRLITLQLQGIRTQLDPHFTFNTLNSVASMIYLSDRQTAYDYMNKFTQLLRVMLSDTERIYRSVAEEVEFVTTYLELEKLRFGDKFNYEIKIGEGVSEREQVPKRVLHTFAENAVKHGLMPCADGGVLKISVLREGESLKLTVEDNGIGRKKSSGKSSSTGIGLKLTGEFYDILNKINKKPIRYSITDLYKDSGEPAGTRVEIIVPLGLT